jgi:hypothetical protein
MQLPRLPKVGPAVAAQVFVAAASLLGAAAASMAIFRFAEGDIKDGLLLSAVAVFTGWMATAILQFQQRLEGIDEVIRQGRERMEQTDAALEEMRSTARRLRSSGSESEKAERRTVH